MQKREGAYFQVFALPSQFWLLLLASCLCPFVSSTLSLASSSSQTKEKKNKHKEKKTIKKEKNLEKAGSLPSFSHFCIWDETLLLLSPFHISSTLSSPLSSSLVFHVSSKLSMLLKLWRWNEWEMK